MSLKNVKLFVWATIIITGCQPQEKNVDSALKSISVGDYKDYISVIASDSLMGRAPATIGEERTIAYLTDEYRKLGLQPANNGRYLQEVPMVKITAEPSMKMSFSAGQKKVDLKYAVDFIGNTSQIKDQVAVDGSDVIFVGYGIDAPEKDWNDYQGLDLKGKTVLMLVNDPGYATNDSSLFKGNAMTYYGRWTYKFEEAARLGATAAVIIHETGAASYPWEVVRNSWSGPQFHLPGNEISTSPLQFQGWITTDCAKELFRSAGLNYDRLTAEAAKPGFKPVAMNLRTSISFRNKIEKITSNNVAAVWPGTDRSDEYIIYTAHWDHFGVNNTYSGDTILNGAMDNATGTAALLEIAKAFTRLPQRQHRSVLFLSVTGEEQGLLGSKYYVENPIFPLNKTVAVINIDAMNIFGKTKDMTIVGYGNSALDKYAMDVLKRHGRYVAPDPHPERGGFFRSDHFSFAKAGVPSLYLDGGIDYVGHGKEWGQEVTQQWIMKNYHKPGDNYEPDKWNFEGLMEDLKVYFEVGYDLSDSGEFPEWSAGSPFKSLRDKMRKD